jgi:hypothetical protein
MATKRSKDYFRKSKTGKLVHVQGHAYDVDADFEAVFGGTKAEPAPKAEPQPFVAPESLNDDFEAAFGKAEPAPKAAGPVAGEKVAFKDVKPGMKFKHKFSTGMYSVTEVNGPDLLATNESGAIYAWNSNEWAAVGYVYVGNDGFQVGDTKTENGVTYVFNANSRWEKQGGAPATPSKSILDWKGKDTPTVDYGGVKASFGKFGLEPAVELTFPMISTTSKGKVISDLSALGIKAHWMPIKKKLQVRIGGMPSASGKAKAKALDLYLTATFGKGATAANQAAETPKKPTPAFAPTTAGAPPKNDEATNANAWKKISDKKGSNPGGVYTDPEGKKWYVKFPATQDIAKNEVLANKLYAAAGVSVPVLDLVRINGEIGVASEWEDGLKKDKAGLIQAGIRREFGVDAWLGNWDVVGMEYDNALISPSGRVVRIDQGGALLYRAQGAPKAAGEFGDTVPEIDTMRSASSNAQAAAVFGGMTGEEIAESIAPIMLIENHDIETIVASWGPGDSVSKAALTQKLLKRKAYLLRRFPASAPVPKANIKATPNFLEWNGPGAGLSTKAPLNRSAAQGPALSEAEISDIVAFIRTLSDGFVAP